MKQRVLNGSLFKKRIIMLELVRQKVRFILQRITFCLIKLSENNQSISIIVQIFITKIVIKINFNVFQYSKRVLNYKNEFI